jgi:hypothetical protein
VNTIDRNRLLTELRGSRDALAAVVQAWIDDVLERPLSDLFDTAELASAIAAGVRGVAADPRNEAFLKQQISTAIDELQSATAGGKLPSRTITALRDLAAQPYVLDQGLVAALLNHEAAHVLLRDVLQQSLLDFTEQVASWFPGGEVAFWLVGKAHGIAAAAVGEVGQSIEARVKASVDEALAPAFGLTAERMADPAFAAQLGDWRGHILDVLLGWPTPELLATLEQVDPEELAAQLAALLHSMADWSMLEQTLQASLESAMGRTGDRSLHQLLSGTSLEQDWRAAVEKQLVEAIWPFVQSAAFEHWLNRLAGPDLPPADG